MANNPFITQDDISPESLAGAEPFVDYGSAPYQPAMVDPSAVVATAQPIVTQPTAITQQGDPLTDIGQQYVGERQQAIGGEKQARINAINAIPNVMGTLSAYQKPDLSGDMEQLDTAAGKLRDIADLKTERVNELKSDIATFKKDLNDAKIEPNRLLANMNTQNKILAGVGMMLSGLTPHTMNASMSLINNAIANDVQAQKDMLGKKETLYSNALKLYGDELTASMVAETKLMEMAINKMEIKYKMATIPAMKAKLGMQLQSAYAAQAEQFAKLNNLVGQSASFDATRQLAGSDTRLTQTQNANLPKEVQQKSIIGLGGSAPTPKERDEVKKLFEGTMGLNRTIEQIIKIANKASTSGSFGVRETDSKALTNLLSELGQYQVIRSAFGVEKNLNLREIDAAKNVLKNPLQWNQRKSKLIKELRTLQGFVSNKFKEKATSSGFRGFPEEIEIGSQYDPTKLVNE